LVSRMRVAHDLCSELRDSATTSILEVFIDETERRVWFLYEASRNATGH
jgi:starvation-inducible DNA-binding protein